MFIICQINSREQMFKGLYMNLWVEAPHEESPPCHVWCPLVWCKWRYKISNILRDLTKVRD